MKLGIAGIFALCAACSSPQEPSANVGVPFTVSDAGTYTGKVCCQITDNATNDPYWQNKLYVCDPDGGVTAVGSDDIPWLCGESADAGVVFGCGDSRCSPGAWCQGFNGTGVVQACN